MIAEPIAELAPRPSARSIGVVYLIYVLVSGLGGVLMRGIVVPGDAVATASHILAHEASYRSGLALGLLGNAAYMVLAVLFYGLFAPVDRSLARIAALFGVVGCGVQIFGGVFQAFPLALLKDAGVPSTIGLAQSRAAALLSIKLYSESYSVSFVLFALFDLAIGALIFRSTFLPRAIGVLFVLGGLGATLFLWPPLARALVAVIIPAGGLAELALLVWLLVKGVDVPRWRERAAARARMPA